MNSTEQFKYRHIRRCNPIQAIRMLDPQAALWAAETILKHLPGKPDSNVTETLATMISALATYEIHHEGRWCSIPHIACMLHSGIPDAFSPGETKRRHDKVRSFVRRMQKHGTKKTDLMTDEAMTDLSSRLNAIPVSSYWLLTGEEDVDDWDDVMYPSTGGIVEKIIEDICVDYPPFVLLDSVSGEHASGEHNIRVAKEAWWIRSAVNEILDSEKSDSTEIPNADPRIESVMERLQAMQQEKTAMSCVISEYMKLFNLCKEMRKAQVHESRFDFETDGDRDEYSKLLLEKSRLEKEMDDYIKKNAQ